MTEEEEKELESYLDEHLYKLKNYANELKRKERRLVIGTMILIAFLIVSSIALFVVFAIEIAKTGDLMNISGIAFGCVLLIGAFVLMHLVKSELMEKGNGK